MSEEKQNQSDSTEKSFVNGTDILQQLQEMHNQNLEKLESIRSEFNGMKRKIEDIDQLSMIPKKMLSPKTDTRTNEQECGPTISKSFVLKHSFEDILSMEKGEEDYSGYGEHFGVKWDMNISRNGEYLGFFTSCSIPTETDEWSVEVDTKVKLFSNCGNDKIYDSVEVYSNKEDNASWGWDDFIKWDEMEENLIDGNLEFEVTMKIKKVTGLYGKNLRDFDETNEECSDVILNVNGVKFYVSKLTLASHSSFFKSMFLGQFDESKKSEIDLSGIDSDDFQKYLEILYSLDSIDEYNVEGILLIADMYDTQIVVQKCEGFLLNKSEKALKKKFDMAVRYNLKELKKDVLSKIKTHDDIRKVLPNKLEEMDPSIMAKLLEKALK